MARLLRRDDNVTNFTRLYSFTATPAKGEESLFTCVLVRQRASGDR
jgi:hypothetical protein